MKSNTVQNCCKIDIQILLSLRRSAHAPTIIYLNLFLEEPSGRTFIASFMRMKRKKVPTTHMLPVLMKKYDTSTLYVFYTQM